MEELRIILAEGEFFVGCEVKEACYQISDVIYLQVDSGGFTKQYDLEQLQDLESRLVLFAGQSAEVSDVQRFLNVSTTLNNSLHIAVIKLDFSYNLYNC